MTTQTMIFEMYQTKIKKLEAENKKLNTDIQSQFHEILKLRKEIKELKK